MYSTADTTNDATMPAAVPSSVFLVLGHRRRPYRRPTTDAIVSPTPMAMMPLNAAKYDVGGTLV